MNWALFFSVLSGDAPGFSTADVRKLRLIVAAIGLLLAYIIWSGLVWLSGGYGPRLGADVHGMVTISGTHAPHGMIVFNPVRGGPIAASVIFPSGQYRMNTGGLRSLAPGHYVVTIAIVEDGGAHAYTPDTAPRSLIDPRYNAVESSGLLCTVKPGRNTLNFDLLPARAGRMR